MTTRNRLVNYFNMIAKWNSYLIRGEEQFFHKKRFRNIEEEIKNLNLN